MKKLIEKLNQLSIVKQIIVGLFIGIILALIIPEHIIFGSLFVGALKAIAPILVFFLVMSVISQHKNGQKTNMKYVIILYIIGTFMGGFTAVVASFIFPVKLTLVAGGSLLLIPLHVTYLVYQMILQCKWLELDS